MNVTDAVEILSRTDGSRYRFEREFAVAVLAGWLNSPESIGDQASMIFAAVNIAIIDANRKQLDIPRVWFTDVYEAELYCGLNAVPLTLSAFWFIEDHLVYNNSRYSADIVRFLVTYKPKSTDKSKRASLGKAWEFINKHGGFVRGNFGLDRSDWCGLSTHHNIWRDYKRSAALQCARFYGSRFDWYIDPRQSDFLDRLVETAGQTEAIHTFFAEALYLQQRMEDVIDARSMKKEDYFRFPHSVKARKCSLPPMSASAYGKMATYRKRISMYAD